MASGQTKGEVEDQIGRKERVERRKRWRERGDNKSRERVKKKKNIKSRKIHVESLLPSSDEHLDPAFSACSHSQFPAS